MSGSSRHRGKSAGRAMKREEAREEERKVKR
jgi:hypothetical protein